MTLHGPDGAGGPHAFVADLDRPELSADDRHHLERALRLRNGDALTASDGRGRWRPCRFGDVVEPTGEVQVVAEPSPRLAVGFALLKQGRPELVVQKLTEIGIDDIRPFVADRSVVRWDEAKRVSQPQRWRRVAREAAMQSRRVWLPTVSAIDDFAAVPKGRGVALAARDGEPPTRDLTGLLIGPEGGFSATERAGTRSVTLGPHVLRAETAAIVAGALMVAVRTGIVHSD